MSYVAFRTAPPIGVHSLLFFFYLGNCQRWQFQNLKQHSPRQSFRLHRKRRHQLLPIGSKSHKPVKCGSCSRRDFSITVQPILKRFSVLKLIQAHPFFFCNLLDIFAPWLRKWVSSGPTVVYALRWWLIAIFSLYVYALHIRFVSYCCRGQLANANLCAVMHERFRNKW